MKPEPPLITPRQWSELQAAAAILGIRAAARAFAQTLPGEQQRACVDRIRQHARRHGWKQATEHAAQLQPPPLQANQARLAPPVAIPAGSVATGLCSRPEKDPGTVARLGPAEPDPAPALVTGAGMIAAVLAKRRERSGLYLSHYLVSASRSLAGSKGDLDLADRAASLARTRAALWPEAGSQAGSEVAIAFDDAGKVKAIHSRLVLALTGSTDPRIAGQAPEERG